jgi:hypothetical protein
MGTFLLPLLIAASTPALAPEPRTPEAVLAADDAWGEAELAGDTKFLDQLLLLEYRSVGQDGRVTDKAKIVAHARMHSGSAEQAAKVAAWKAAHPTRGEVTIFGDTAVLRWVLLKPESGDPVSSSDIFVYRGDHWHAIYSQHTSASN